MEFNQAFTPGNTVSQFFEKYFIFTTLANKIFPPSGSALQKRTGGGDNPGPRPYERLTINV